MLAKFSTGPSDCFAKLYLLPTTRNKKPAGGFSTNTSAQEALRRLFIGKQHKYCHHQNGAGNIKKVFGFVCDGLSPGISNLLTCC